MVAKIGHLNFERIIFGREDALEIHGIMRRERRGCGMITGLEDIFLGRAVSLWGAGCARGPPSCQLRGPKQMGAGLAIK
jgi:hypothetical protein